MDYDYEYADVDSRRRRKKRGDEPRQETVSPGRSRDGDDRYGYTDSNLDVNDGLRSRYEAVRLRSHSNPNYRHTVFAPPMGQGWRQHADQDAHNGDMRYAPPQVRFEVPDRTRREEQPGRHRPNSHQHAAEREDIIRPAPRPVINQHRRRYSSFPNARADTVEPHGSRDWSNISTASRAQAAAAEAILQRSVVRASATNKGESTESKAHAAEREGILKRSKSERIQSRKAPPEQRSRDMQPGQHQDDWVDEHPRSASAQPALGLGSGRDDQNTGMNEDSGRGPPRNLAVPIISVRPSSEADQKSAARPSSELLSPSLPSRGSSGSTGIPMVAPGTPYEYRRLEGTEIRLLRLLPVSMSAIKCQLVNTTLEQPPRYVALSYAWGNGDDTAEILVDGHKHRITASLHGALQRLRQPRESVYVWADAVCINQHDKAELSQQVRYMTSIFLQAEYVAIWLGPDADDSSLAIDLVRQAVRASRPASGSGSPPSMTTLISSRQLRRHFAALVALFERPYWRRLWVVQEVLSARTKTVYCGPDEVAWDDLVAAAEAFASHASDINHFFPSGLSTASRHQLSHPVHSYARVLGSRGPASFHALQAIRDGGPRTLLEVLHTCRTKLAADPRDKVFAIIGILPEHVGVDFPIDYSASIREVYTNVVDFLLHSDRLDVICEAIYFPLHTSNASLPTWVPDWSHMPQTGALGLSYDFNAAGKTKADFQLLEQRSKLSIKAVHLDIVAMHGIAVGTLCTLDDYLMAFLHWRAKLLDNAKVRHRYGDDHLHDAFCRTLRLGQPEPGGRSSAVPATDWTTTCYHVYASLLRDRLPHITLDHQLAAYADMTDLGIDPDRRRGILQENCGSRMMGRCFFITKSGMMGLGTGFMDTGDVVCVPFGCNTPIILRAEGSHGEHRLVGDCYVEGYMHGEAIEGGDFETTAFVLH